MLEIQKELIERRTANSKTFDLGKGRRHLVISIGDVHYKDNYADKSERWKDIDLTWEDNRITKAPYELTHEGNELTLKNKKTGKIATIELLDIGGKKIPDVAWERSKGLARAHGIATIDNVALGTDLEVIAKFSAVKFRRVLKSDKAPQEAKFKVTGDTSLIAVRASDEDGDIPVESNLKDGILTETLKPDRAVKYPIRIDPTWQVGTTTDNAIVRWNGSVWVCSTTADLLTGSTSDVGNYKYGNGLRFTNITIPKGSTINNGTHLTVVVSYSGSGTTVNSKIRGEATDSAATFSDLDNYFARGRTETTVLWNGIPAWTAEDEKDSPEIKSVIQETINREGWNSGNNLVVFWDDHDGLSSSGAHRYAYDYQSSSSKAAKLVIDYTTLLIPQNVGGGVLAITGALSTVRIFTQNVGGASLAVTSALSKFTSKNVGGSLNIVGTLVTKFKSKIAGYFFRFANVEDSIIFTDIVD